MVGELYHEKAEPQSLSSANSDFVSCPECKTDIDEHRLGRKVATAMFDR